MLTELEKQLAEALEFAKAQLNDVGIFHSKIDAALAAAREKEQK